VTKPIYNHVNGTLDEPEEIKPTPIIIFEGLHPFHDDRVNDLMDFRIYVDITPEVKFNWKVQRDHEERGHSIESIKESIEARKPDFDAHIDPQKNKADCVIQVPTYLPPLHNPHAAPHCALAARRGSCVLASRILLTELRRVARCSRRTSPRTTRRPSRSR